MIQYTSKPTLSFETGKWNTTIKEHLVKFWTNITIFTRNITDIMLSCPAIAQQSQAKQESSTCQTQLNPLSIFWKETPPLKNIKPNFAKVFKYSLQRNKTHFLLSKQIIIETWSDVKEWVFTLQERNGCVASDDWVKTSIWVETSMGHYIQMKNMWTWGTNHSNCCEDCKFFGS